jgi:hypothetical protein
MNNKLNKERFTQYSSAIERIKTACTGKLHIETALVFEIIKESLNETVIVGTPEKGIVSQLHDIWFPPIKS